MKKCATLMTLATNTVARRVSATHSNVEQTKNAVHATMDAFVSRDLIGTRMETVSVIRATKTTQTVHDLQHARKHRISSASLTPRAHAMKAKSATVSNALPINVTALLIDVASTQRVR